MGGPNSIDYRIKHSAMNNELECPNKDDKMGLTYLILTSISIEPRVVLNTCKHTYLNTDQQTFTFSRIYRIVTPTHINKLQLFLEIA